MLQKFRAVTQCAAWLTRSEATLPDRGKGLEMNPPDLANVNGVWKQARRSLAFASLIAAGFLLCFAALVLQLPKPRVSMTISHERRRLVRLLE